MIGRQAGFFSAILLLMTPPDATAIEANAATCFGYVLEKTKAAGLPSNQVEELEPFFRCTTQCMALIGVIRKPKGFPHSGQGMTR